MRINRLDNAFATLLVLFTLYFLSIIFVIDFLDPIQNTIEDFNATDIIFSQVRDYEQYPKDTNIVIVNNSYLGRDSLALQLRIIDRYKPKVIAMDMLFSKAKGEEYDQPLLEAFRDIDNVFIMMQFEDFDPDKREYIKKQPSYSPFLKYTEQAYANLWLNADEYRTVESVVPWAYYKGKKVYSLSTKAAMMFDSAKTARYLARDNIKEMINFKRNINKYTVIDAYELFERQDELHFLKNKIVLMGFMGPDLNTPDTEDIFFSPMNPNYMGKAYPDMYGVVVHANIISMILEEDYIYSLPYWLIMTITIALIYVNMVLFTLTIKKFERWYEPFNLLFTLFELVALFIIMAFSLHVFGVEIGLTEAALFGLMFSATSFELYHGALKPLVNKLIIGYLLPFGNMLASKFKKKEQEVEEEEEEE